jgi:hypothetical protein
MLFKKAKLCRIALVERKDRGITAIFVFFEFFCGDGVLTRLITVSYGQLRRITPSYA